MKLLLLVCILHQLTINAVEQAPNEDNLNSKLSSSNTSSHNIEVAALDRLADFGALYDATTDNFMYASAFNGKEKPEDFNIITTNITSSKVDVALNETVLEKMEKLDIQPSLFLSSLADLVRISSIAGAASYLTESKSSDKSVKISLIYRIRTVREEIQILPNISKSIISDILLDDRFSFTHVLVGIEWGADAVLSLEDPDADPSKATQIHQKLENALKAAADMITTADQIDSSKFVEVEKGNATIKVDLLGDYRSIGGLTTSNNPRFGNHLPLTACLSTLRTLPDLMKGENNGKGKRKKYILMPINEFVENLGEKFDSRKKFRQPSQETTREFLEIFQKLKDVELKLEDLNDLAKKRDDVFSRSEIFEVKKLRDGFNAFRYRWRDGVKEKLFRYRRGFVDDDEISSEISSYGNSTWTPEDIRAKLDTMKPILRKINWLNRLQRAKALFIKKYEVSHVISRNNREIRIVSMDLKKDNAEHYVNEIAKLLEIELAKTSNAIRYYIVQEEIEEPEVKTFEGGEETDSFAIV